MVHFEHSGNAAGYPFRTHARQANTQIQGVINAQGLPGAAKYLIDNYADDVWTLRRWSTSTAPKTPRQPNRRKQRSVPSTSPLIYGDWYRYR